MKKIILTLLLLGAFLIPPLVLAQEQAQPYLDQDSGQTQVYSGFGRFVDNVKMFFSFGDKKVMLALDIREKELDSAIINTKNGETEKAEENLERATKMLQHVQKKVSENIAEDVKTNIDETINKMNIEENLPDSFEIYVLEEEKTQLIAELVIEVEGKEGQILTREIVKDSESGKKEVEIVVEGVEEGDGETKVMEIEVKIGEINNQIKERTFIEEDVKTGIEAGDDGSTSEIETDAVEDDDIVDNFVDDNEDDDILDDFVDNSEGEGIVGDTGTTVGPVTNQIDNGSVLDNIVGGVMNIIEGSPNNVIDEGTDAVETGSNVVDEGTDVVETGMDIDDGDDIDDTTPKTPVPTDGSICCKKTMSGHTKYSWDFEDECLNPTTIKGEVVDNDVCVALGDSINDEEDPEIWGYQEGGVPEECVNQGAYDDESCAKIMEEADVCCKKTINGEMIYSWDPGNICTSPYGERMDDSFCLE